MAATFDLDRAREFQPPTSDAGSGPRPRRAPPLRVLFAAAGFTRSLHALRRAAALAERWHGELCVLLVAAPRTRGDAEPSAADAGAVRRVQQFCGRSLEAAPPRERILSRA